MKIKQIKIPIDIVPTYTLVRERDGLTKVSNSIKWIEFGSNGEYTQDYNEIKVGRSLLMRPFCDQYIWLTTSVVEILSEAENYIKFKTNNSTYKLTKSYENNKDYHTL
ncbi:hypothetical protein AVT43_gp06 [Polaribacter phage P12002L]|uniref:Uncharacterized protein n=2 Tax=Incheonvirus TaxID=2976977 RepID=A0A0F7IJM9_9CAUD|nr:hypothetical protein AVT42_gp06 [Polaribacter phage P12002S]YP_009209666.1 hypothetical protein AVT43_gp06 [Polaribacter phage P12002L]AKG94180.1 hypothetical protein P12002L_0006 [Polaribacter phage P12002L]AKG94262.1 hypothetical protein P12002S_0006 [Polaribacter phage P12002S]